MNNVTKKILLNCLNLFFLGIMLLFYIKLLIFGEIKYYLNPFMSVFSWILFVFIVIVSILSVVYIFIHKKGLNFKIFYLIYFVPFFLVIFFKPSTLSIRNFKRKQYKNNVVTNVQYNNEVMDNNEVKTEAYKNEIKSIIKKENEGEKEKEYQVNYTITGKNFYKYCDILYNPDTSGKYLNSIFEITGMYFYDEEYCYKNQGFVGRYLITCCAADAIPAVFYLEFNKIPELNNKYWIRIIAELKNKKTPLGDKPVFEVLKWTVTQEEDAYIYPVY